MFLDMDSEAEMFSDWASRMDQSYAPFYVYEDFKAAQEATRVRV